MFAVHYFPEHYFARTYFSHLGAAIVANICELGAELKASSVLVSLGHSEIGVNLRTTSIDVAITCHAHAIVPALAGYKAKAVNFDGTVLVSGAAFASDSPYGLLSVWSKSSQKITFIDKPDSGNFAVVFSAWHNEPDPPSLSIFGTFYDVANTNYWDHGTVEYLHDYTLWTNTLMSWDMNHAAGSRIVQVYISDVAMDNYPNGVGGPISVDLTTGQTFVLRDAISFYGGIVADVADYYFDTAYLDLSIEANRRKFISASGKPVDLGANGELPKGSPPQIFFSGNADSFLTNKGIGPIFNHTGILTNSTDSPSD